jgi:SAM-dependent methyltransferase
VKQQFDDVAASYAEQVNPRFEPIASLIPARLGPSSGPRTVLEIAAGTGLLTGLMAPDTLRAGGSWLATDLSTGMLRVARDAVGAGVRWATADAGALPLSEGAVDLVVSSLGPVQESVELFAEARRVLCPDGRLAITLWDAGYAELEMMREPRRRMGAPEFAADPTGDAAKRARAAGFVDVGYDVTSLDVVHHDLDAYLEFRAAFGHPPFVPPGRLDDWFGLIRAAAADHVDGAGRVVLDWRVAVLTARRSD